MPIIFATEYLGPISTYALLYRHGEGSIERHENYQKKSPRNRLHILGPNGVQVLSVPLQRGKNAQTPIAEVDISYDQDWIAMHLTSIDAAYGGSPFYEHYIGELTEILEKRHTKLYNLNMALLSWMIKRLDIEVNIGETDIYQRAPTCIDLRHPSSARSYRSEAQLQPYCQVFEDRHGYIRDLSILDLLMCTGPEAKYYI